MNDMHPNTLSKDSPVSNDITKGTSVGSSVGVKRDVINPSGGMSDISKKIKHLFIRSGSGKKLNL